MCLNKALFIIFSSSLNHIMLVFSLYYMSAFIALHVIVFKSTNLKLNFKILIKC